MNSNPGKTYSENLDLLIQTLRKLNYSLAPELQIDSFTHNKLITACEAIPDFKNACRKPVSTISGLISDLRATATSYDRLNPIKPEALFTDRRYYRNRSSRNDRPSSHQNSQFKNNTDRQKSSYSTKCYVCNKEGCRS